MDKEINELLQRLDRSMECVLEADPRTLKDPECEYGWLFNKIHEWRKLIHPFWTDEEDTDIDYQKAKKVADSIIAYLSRNYDDFSLINLFVKCEAENIPNYQTILSPTNKNYLNADDETLTKIVQTYDKDLIVKDNIIIHVTNKEKNSIFELDKNLNTDQNTKNYANAISEALDKLD
jgi:hypothetical protein